MLYGYDNIQTHPWRLAFINDPKFWFTILDFRPIKSSSCTIDSSTSFCTLKKIVAGGNRSSVNRTGIALLLVGNPRWWTWKGLWLVENERWRLLRAGYVTRVRLSDWSAILDFQSPSAPSTTPLLPNHYFIHT